MDFSKRFEKWLCRIEAALSAVLPPESRRPAVLHRAMRYSVMSGGKRLRPLLCLAAADAVGGDVRQALKPAVAVELFHTYTLVHDDLPCMDDDDFRRGRPTVHRVFGEANALLAGDALQALAFEVLAGARPAGRLVLELACAAGSAGVVGGQVEDLAANPEKVDEATVRYIHQHKTADLFGAAVRMGALSGGARAADLKALAEYARCLGLAFQIVDDVLDGVAGKPSELSCLAVYDAATARRKARRLRDRALAGLRRFPARRRAALEDMVWFAVDREH